MMWKVAAIAGTISSSTFAMIHALNQRGYHVLLSSSEREICLEKLQATGAMVEYMKCDTGNLDLQAWTDYIKNNLRRLDLFIYSARIPFGLQKELMHITSEMLQTEVFEQLHQCFFMCQGASRLLLEMQREGKAEGLSRMVIMTALPPDARNNQIHKLYTDGITSIAAMFANELADHLIPLFEISGGVCLDNVPVSKVNEYIQLIANGAVPMNRFCQPDDIVKCVMAIEGGLLDFSMGQKLYADGGHHIRWSKF